MVIFGKRTKDEIEDHVRDTSNIAADILETDPDKSIDEAIILANNTSAAMGLVDVMDGKRNPINAAIRGASAMMIGSMVNDNKELVNKVQNHMRVRVEFQKSLEMVK